MARELGNAIGGKGRWLVLILLVAEPAFASRRDWVGSGACGACHPKELAAWQASPHASTRARFPGRPQSKCLACHGTGEAPAGDAIAVEVGCEACHGAGAAYAFDDVMRDRPVALALGLVEAPRQTCAGCHARATRSAPFDPKAPVHSVK
jgi:hypothetical protein